MTRHYSALCAWGVIVDGSGFQRSLVLRPWALVRPWSLASLVLGVLGPWALVLACLHVDLQDQAPRTKDDQGLRTDKGRRTKDQAPRTTPFHESPLVFSRPSFSLMNARIS